MGTGLVFASAAAITGGFKSELAFVRIALGACLILGCFVWRIHYRRGTFATKRQSGRAPVSEVWMYWTMNCSRYSVVSNANGWLQTRHVGPRTGYAKRQSLTAELYIGPPLRDLFLCEIEMAFDRPVGNTESR